MNSQVPCTSGMRHMSWRTERHLVNFICGGHFQTRAGGPLVRISFTYTPVINLGHCWAPVDQSCHLSVCETTLSLWREQRLITQVSNCKLCSQVLSDPQSHAPLRPGWLRQVWLKPCPTGVTAALLATLHGTPLGKRFTYWWKSSWDRNLNGANEGDPTVFRVTIVI